MPSAKSILGLGTWSNVHTPKLVLSEFPARWQPDSKGNQENASGSRGFRFSFSDHRIPHDPDDRVIS
jgi:hypothetical protein